MKRVLLFNTMVLAVIKCAVAQQVPSVVTPSAIPYNYNQVPPSGSASLTFGQIWTAPGQWSQAWRNKKDVITFFALTSTTGSTTLTTDGTPANANNVGTIPNNTAVALNNGNCVVFDRNTKYVNSYSMPNTIIENSSNTITIPTGFNALTGTLISSIPSTGGLSLSVLPGFAADLTHKGWVINYSPPLANTDPLYAECTFDVHVVQ